MLRIAAEPTDSGARFNDDRTCRYLLWRHWDSDKPFLMFIGLNPSTANEHQDDATIRSITRITRELGYGGFYMCNCFPLISTDPEVQGLAESGSSINDYHMLQAATKCEFVVFAWGNFEIVKRTGRDRELATLFPGAKVLGLNKAGSPKHPLYLKTSTKLLSYNAPTI
jgi:hypothetical protein